MNEFRVYLGAIASTGSVSEFLTLPTRMIKTIQRATGESAAQVDVHLPVRLLSLLPEPRQH